MFLDRSNETAAATRQNIFHLLEVNFHDKKAFLRAVYADIVDSISMTQAIKKD
jgi:hypothetical protein